MQNIEPLIAKVSDAAAPLADRLAAFCEIVSGYQDMTYGCAYALLGDFHLAQDAAQEAFITAYRELPNLRTPAAFPGWLKRIVVSQCQRITRLKGLPIATLDAAGTVVSAEPGPPEALEEREMQDQVLAAIRALPRQQRLATTLFYINGYSQKDIAAFLEVPLTTVKKRLSDSRSKLKQRMIAMVEETLHKNAPDERFSKKVISNLLAHPNLLEIQNHPVRKVWDDIRTCLNEYEVVIGDEIEDKETFAAAEDHAWNLAYRMAENRSLRYQMTTVTMKAIRCRKPPVRLLAPGRVFRPLREDKTHFKVFHQVDGVCLEAGADVEAFKSACERMLQAVVPDATIIWQDHDFGFVAPGFDALMKKGLWKCEVLGGGMLCDKTLQDAGYDTTLIRGYAWGLSLERLAMLKYGIDDIRKLWQPPYVPK